MIEPQIHFSDFLRCRICASDRVTKIADRNIAIWDRRKVEITVPRYDIHYDILQKGLLDGRSNTA
jgi:hypothetical protein